MSPTVILVDASQDCVSDCARRTHSDMQWITLASDDLVLTQLQNCKAVAFLGDRWNSERIAEAVKLKLPILVSSQSAVTQPAFDCSQVEVGNSLATLPSRRLVLEQLKSGKLGDPGMIRIHRWTSASPFSINAPNQRSQLFEEIDFVLRCYGESPCSLLALPIANECGVLIHLRFSNSRTAIIDFCVSNASADYASFSLVGSTGTATADDHSNVQLIAKSGAIEAIPTRETANDQANMVREFVQRRLFRPIDDSNPVIDKTAERTEQSLAILQRIQDSLLAGQALSI